MARYNSELSLGRTILYSLILFLVTAAIMLVPIVTINSVGAIKINAKAEHGTVTYNDVNGVSSLDVEASFKSPHCLLHFSAINTTYKLIFKDKDGNVLSEQVLTYADPIKTVKGTASTSFGAEGDYPAINGKVESVDVEILDYEFTNEAKLSGASSPWKFIFSSSMVLIYIYFVLALLEAFCAVNAISEEKKGSFVFYLVTSVIMQLLSTTKIIIAFFM